MSLVPICFCDGSLGASFLGLGVPGDVSGFSRAWAISADGSTVVGEHRTADGIEAFRWTRTSGMVGLGDLPGGAFGSVAHGVSADGSVIVGAGRSAASGDGREAFRWSIDGGMVGLGDLDGGEFDSIAFGVSADGSVIVGSSAVSEAYALPNHGAFLWTSDRAMVNLNVPVRDEEASLGNRSAAYGVSADGTVVVGRLTTSGGWDDLRAGVWTADRGWATYPGERAGDESGQAIAITADGSVIVGSVNAPDDALTHEAYRWNRSGGTAWLESRDLAREPSPFGNTVATAISADGQVIVGILNAARLPNDPSRVPDLSPYSRPFVWDPIHGFRPLDEVFAASGILPSGWTILEARGISGDGRTIIGTGINPLGQFEAWVATYDRPPPGTIGGGVVPEPPTVALTMIGLAGFLMLRRWGAVRPGPASVSG